MKVFTVRNGSVSEGAKVEKRILKGAGVEIDAILVGEEGRGRELGVLPVQGAPADGILRYAAVGQTKAGKPKLVAQANAGDTSACIVVFRTQCGFRGGAEHSGDVVRETYALKSWALADARAAGVVLQTEYTPSEAMSALLTMDAFLHPGSPPLRNPDLSGRFERSMELAPFPGEVICRGTIAQGDAGRMGGNEQLIAVMPRDVWFRTAYTGRLYGAPAEHYYRFDGERIIAVTWEERQLLEEGA